MHFKNSKTLEEIQVKIIIWIKINLLIIFEQKIQNINKNIRKIDFKTVQEIVVILRIDWNCTTYAHLIQIKRITKKQKQFQSTEIQKKFWKVILTSGIRI